SLRERPMLLNVLLHEIAEQEGKRILLFVDQFEEIYTHVGDEGIRRRFVEAVCRAEEFSGGPVRIVVTIRDDFLGHVAEGIERGSAFERIVVLRRPTPVMLEKVLTMPLSSVGYRFDDLTLVAEMIASVQDEPACLPLLQFAGQMLWERRDHERQLLLRSAYETIGGVAGALAEHADGVLAGLGPEQVKAAREMLLALVTPEGTRRVVAVRDLRQSRESDGHVVFGRLVEGRLLTLRKGGGREGTDAVVELAHESLTHSWKQLARWLEESKEERVFLSEIGRAAELWQQRGRRNEEVWQGDALADARRKLARLSTETPGHVAEFMLAGLRKERRRRRNKRLLAAGIMAFLAIVAGWSLLRERETRVQKERAEQREIEAQIQRAEAQREGANAALLRRDLLEARAKLRGSLETSDSTMGRVLWGQLRQDPLVWSRKLGDQAMDVAYAPDGRTIASACADGRVYLIDSETTTLRTLRGEIGPLKSVAFSPDGRYLAAGSYFGRIALWNLLEGTVKELAGHSQTVFDLAFDTTGTLLASACYDTTVRLWDVESGNTLFVPWRHRLKATRVGFDAAGRLFSSGVDGMVRKWDVRTGIEQHAFSGDDAWYGLAIDGARNRLATGGFSGTIRLWRADTGEEKAVLDGHRDLVVAVAFAAGGQALASGSTDQSVRLWDLASGTGVVIGRHQDIVTGVEFSPDDRRLASSSRDGTVKVWRPWGTSDNDTEHGHSGAILTLATSSDGATIASGGKDRTVRTWDTRSGRQLMVLEGHRGEVTGVSFAPNGGTLASASFDRGVRIWSTSNGNGEELAPRHDGNVLDVASTGDGKDFVSADAKGVVRFWNTQTLSPNGMVSGPVVSNSIAVSPDGKWIAGSAEKDSVFVWARTTLRLEMKLDGHAGEVRGVAFTADGNTLVSGGADGTVWRWDLTSKTGNVLGTRDGPVTRLAISPDGRLVGIPSTDGRIWELATGKTTAVLAGHRDGLTVLRFTPDGKLAITSSTDGTVRTWEVATGRPYWRAPLILRSPPRILTHLGWARLDGAPELAETTTSSAWRRAVAEEARIAVQAATVTATATSQPADSGENDLLCLLSCDDELQLWKMARDELLARKPLARVSKLAATRNGCLALADGRALLLTDATSPIVSLASSATALTFQGGHILVASGKKALLFDEKGNEQAKIPVDRSVTALGIAGGGRLLVVGYDAGHLDLLPIGTATTKPSFGFEETIRSPVELISEGPRQTLVVGYASGDLGIWSMETGRHLRHFKLHGPVVHLLVDSESRRLYAATEMGDYLAVDLTALYQDYCELLGDIWGNVPVVWDGGVPVARRPPADHRCR
ncbi:MAG: WD40 repeat domain-containing protein, partial [Pseudomonadota bacterium]